MLDLSHPVEMSFILLTIAALVGATIVGVVLVKMKKV